MSTFVESMDYNAAIPDIPSDELDPSFSVSFDYKTEAAQALDFFNEYGFVVFNNIYSESECSTTKDAMWNVVESEYSGLDRNNMNTWSLYKSTGKYGMSMRGPCFDPVLVRNRCNANLNAALKTLIGDDVMVSQDRYTIFRATVSATEGESDTNSKSNEYDQFRTGERNIHLDLNPWWFFDPSGHHSVIRGINSLKYEDPHDFIKENNYVVGPMGLHVQCILNFADNHSEDGGTVLCPTYHRRVQAWCSRENSVHLPSSAPAEAPGGVAVSNNIDLKGNMPWVTFDRFPFVEPCAPAEVAAEAAPRPTSTDGSSYPKKPKPKGGQKQKQAYLAQLKQRKLHDFEAHVHAQLLGGCHRVPMRAGSVLIWNQLLFHGTSPNMSARCRFAQYIKAFPRHYDQRLPGVATGEVPIVETDYSADHHSRLRRRATALYRELIKAGFFSSQKNPQDAHTGTDVDVDQSLLRSVDPDTLRLFGLDVLLV